jgi:hypothetical protein
MWPDWPRRRAIDGSDSQSLGLRFVTVGTKEKDRSDEYIQCYGLAPGENA